MEFAVDVEGGHVFLDVEGVGHVGGVEDEVEFEGVLFGPVLFARDDEFLRAHLQRVVLLPGAVGESVDLGAEGFGPEDTEMTESTAGKDQSEKEKEMAIGFRRTYTPRIATFFPGPIFARTRGL